MHTYEYANLCKYKDICLNLYIHVLIYSELDAEYQKILLEKEKNMAISNTNEIEKINNLNEKITLETVEKITEALNFELFTKLKSQVYLCLYVCIRLFMYMCRYV
jgi:TRAP-type C4-dicarboxylate transport system substrate-binding protein